jgi:hypothetical protein
LAFLVAILIAYSIESLERANEHAQFAARFQMFKFYLWRERKP